MRAQEQTQPKVPTRDGWLEILSRHASPQIGPTIRRRTRRHNVEFGVVRLVYQCNGKARDYTVSLLGISADGLMVRNHTYMQVDTPLRMEVTFDNDSVALNGRVAHCTETVGAYKIGIRLQFADQP